MHYTNISLGLEDDCEVVFADGSVYAPSLSKAHISPAEEEPSYLHLGKASFYLGGSLMTVKRLIVAPEGIGGGKRGKITGFSQASRNRLLKKIATVEKRHLPHFLTLTYPADYPTDFKTVKKHLDILWKRVERAFPAYGAIWKLEAQKRGAPHFHCLIWGLLGYKVTELTRWFASNWADIVASGDENHFKWHMGWLGSGNRPCISYVKSFRGVWSYASKYIGKVEDAEGWDEPGRFWGVRGRIPVAPLVWFGVNDREACHLLRILRRAGKFKRCNPTVSLFCDAEFWFDRMDRLLRRSENVL